MSYNERIKRQAEAKAHYVSRAGDKLASVADALNLHADFFSRYRADEIEDFLLSLQN